MLPPVTYQGGKGRLAAQIVEKMRVSITMTETAAKPATKKARSATVGGRSDMVMTPDLLAFQIVGHFLPLITGRVLEPCAGEGAFVRAFITHGLTNIVELELTRGQDFFEYHDHADWIITNPPWSLARRFAQHAYEMADNIVWLINTGHFLGFRARLRDCRNAGFGVKEVLLCNTPPKPWPQSGFQLGALYFQRGWVGPTQFSVLNEGCPER